MSFWAEDLCSLAPAHSMHSGESWFLFAPACADGIAAASKGAAACRGDLQKREMADLLILYMDIVTMRGGPAEAQDGGHLTQSHKLRNHAGRTC